MCASIEGLGRNGTTGLTLQQLAHVLAPVLLRRDEQKPERTEAIKRQNVHCPIVDSTLGQSEKTRHRHASARPLVHGQSCATTVVDERPPSRDVPSK